MPDLPTRLDLYAAGRDYVLQRAQKIDPAQVDIEGSDVNLFVGSGSVVAAQVLLQLAFRTNALLLDGAEGEDLDRYAFDRYSITRKGASPALGTVRIFRSSAAAGAGTVPIGTKLTTLTGSEYVTTTTASFSASDLESAANVRAVQAGKATQAGANAITRFTSPATLFDGTLQANNDAPTAGGEDAEDDETFRARVRDFWRTARRGILAAIEFGALTVPGVVSAQAIEALTAGNLPARVVNLYISDSTGVASDALADQVRVALDEYRAAGIAVLISTSLPLIVDVELKLTFRAGVDTLTLKDNVRAAVVEFINSLPVNGTLYEAQLLSVVQRYAEDGVIPDDQTVVAPVGDLVPDIGQTIRTTLANVTVT
jgi:uncharacterized phage protein gp47/JayE